MNTEAALKNSEEMNIKLVRGRKEMEKKLQDMEQHISGTNSKLSSTQTLLRDKEMEIAGQKSKLAAYDNKEGMKQTIDELTAQLTEKDSVLQVATEEAKVKGNLLQEATNMIQKLSDERMLIFEQSQKFKGELDMINKKEGDLQQIKLENNRLAQVIIEHERIKHELEE